MVAPAVAVKPPSKPTLRRYGWTAEEWWARWEEQGLVCAICQVAPRTGRVVTDHEHVRGWKKMPPEERKNYIRGLLCWTCNANIVRRGITIQKLENAATYLRIYRERRANA